MTRILKAVFDGRESSRPLNADRAVRFLCWDNHYDHRYDYEDACGESPPLPRNHHYLTAGTDEVSMGMVKRVLYTATWGSCRDPEAVSWSRNKSGGQENV